MTRRRLVVYKDNRTKHEALYQRADDVIAIHLSQLTWEHADGSFTHFAAAKSPRFPDYLRGIRFDSIEYKPDAAVSKAQRDWLQAHCMSYVGAVGEPA